MTFFLLRSTRGPAVQTETTEVVWLNLAGIEWRDRNKRLHSVIHHVLEASVNFPVVLFVLLSILKIGRTLVWGGKGQRNAWIFRSSALSTEGASAEERDSPNQNGRRNRLEDIALIHQILTTEKLISISSSNQLFLFFTLSVSEPDYVKNLKKYFNDGDYTGTYYRKISSKERSLSWCICMRLMHRHTT